MKLEYYLIPRKNPTQQDAAPKFYPVVNYYTGDSYRDLVSRVCEFSTVRSPDVLSVLESLFIVIPKFLAEGRIIRLGELGSLRITLQSSGSEVEEDFSESKIDSIAIRFIQSKTLRRTLGNIEYSKISRPEKG